MHQAVGQLTRTGHQKQAFGVQVQAADRLPLAMVQLGQAPKHGGAIQRVVVGDHFAAWLVIGDHARRGWINTDVNRLAIDLDRIAELNPLPDVRGLGIDGNPTLQNQLLHL